MPRLLLSSAFVLTAAVSFNIHAALAQWPNDPQRQFTKSRVVEAAIWGMPAVNYERLLEAATANGGKANQVIYCSRPVNWRNQTLTPNPDTIYFNPFYDTRSGPMKGKTPAMASGLSDHVWTIKELIERAAKA